MEWLTVSTSFSFLIILSSGYSSKSLSTVALMTSDILIPSFKIKIGILDKVSFSKLSICFWKPLESAKTKDMPIIPIEAAKLVSNVRPFFVLILFKERPKAVIKLIFVLFKLYSLSSPLAS